MMNTCEVTKAVEKAVAELLVTKLCNIKTREHSLKFCLNIGKETTQGQMNIRSLLIHGIMEADSSSGFKSTNSCTSNL